jgi:hypothetical protein
LVKGNRMKEAPTFRVSPGCCDVMKYTSTLWAIALWACVTLPVRAEIQIGSFTTPQHAFGGSTHSFSFFVTNTAETEVNGELSFRLYQVATAVAAPVPVQIPTKSLRVLPRQTVVESVSLPLPAVGASTRFQVTVTAGGKKAGGFAVRVHPTNLLDSVRTMADKQPFLVVDSGEKVRNALEALKIPIVGTTEDEVSEHEKAELLIIHEAAALKQEDLSARIGRLLAGKVRNSILFVPAETSGMPNSKVLQSGRTRVLVASTELLNGLPDTAGAQLTLKQLIESALQPRALSDDN